MLQRQMEERDWRYDTPFAGGSAYSTLEVRTSLEPPQRVYKPAYRQPTHCPQNPFDTAPAPSPPMSQPISRNPSLSLQVPPSPHSARRSSNTRVSHLDREKTGEIHATRSTRSSRRPTPDPEKAAVLPNSMRSIASSQPVSHHSTVIYEDDEEYERSDPKYHTVWIMMYLSACNPLLTACLTIYTLLASLTILILSPLCLCTTRQPTRTHFHRFLLPPLHFQLGLIYSRYDPDEASPPQSTLMLILINTLSPFVAFAFSIAAWVAAAFWMFANILGNPSKDQGQEKINEDRNEGQAAVLGVRRWWETWLLRGLR